MITSVLPCSWQWATLDEIAAPVPNAIVDGPFGSNLKLDDYVDEGVPVLQGKNITNDSFRWFDVRFISDRKAEELKRSSVRVGDILIVKIGSIGYSAILDDLKEFDYAIIPANLAKVTPDAAKVDLCYLHRWLTSTDAKRYLVRAASKTAQPALSLGKIKSLPVPLPPLPEQRRIAGILDKADMLRAKRRAALAQLDTLTQSIFLDMFGDPATNPKGWPRQRLGQLAEVSSGAGFPLDYQGDEEGDYPFFKVGDMNTPGNELSMNVAKHMITEEVRTTLRAEAFPEGAVIFPKIGAAIATNKKRVLVRPSCVDNNVMAVVPGALLESAFLFSLLQLKNLSDFAQKGNPPSIRKTDVERWEIPLPSLVLQREYVRRLDAANKLRVAYLASMAELNALFASLRQRAFRGEL